MAKAQDFRINSEIRAREVRVIDSGGEQLGIMTLNEARDIAEAKSMDLVEVAGTAQPPVVRIMDFHKFRYEQRKKVQESRKKSTSPAQQMKEVKLRSRTEAHDIEFKTSHIRRFLAAGHRVKVTVFFKGREISRPDMGKQMLLKVLATITDVAAAEGDPRLEGRNMSVVVVPTKQKPDKPEKSEKAEKADKAEKSDKKAEKPDKAEKSEKAAVQPPEPAEGENNAES